jgi:hypothetical protein
MDPAKATDAQTAYAVQSALVDLRLADLRAALDKHERVRPIVASRVNAIERVEVLLAEIVVLLEEA